MADRTLPGLLLIALAGLVLLSALIAVGHVLAEELTGAGGHHLSAMHLLNVTLQALRACIGTDSLPAEEDNITQQILSTLASVTGALVPAAVMALVVVKLFTVRSVVWRRKGSIARASLSNPPEFARAHQDSDEAVIAIRFYNPLLNVALMEAQAEAHLRYLDQRPLDGLLAMYKRRLKVVGEDGLPCNERVWSVVEHAAPFTLWIPVGAPVRSLPLETLQGKDLSRLRGVRLIVRFRAKVVGTGTELSDERWFRLEGEDMELGAFVPVEPDLNQPVRSWNGWEHFDDLRSAPPPDEVPRAEP